MRGRYGQRGAAASASSCWFFPALWGDTRASQIVEFAVTLPLLAIFVVGIFDFGNAFSVKYKVTNAAREGARLAASQPTLDLTDPNAGQQGSVETIAELVGTYLLASKLDDCGLAAVGQQTVIHTNGTLTWTYTTDAARCAGTLTLEVNRGYTFLDPTTTSYPSGMTVEATRVTLSYPYRWQFNKVVQLLVPGGSFTGPTQITSVAIMQNLN